MNATTDVTTGTNVEPAPGGTVLEMRSITKTFGAVAALTDVDLDVAAGQVVALVGDNGAGKSTLAKILSGVYPPDSGTITFESEEVTIPSPAAAHQLGIATVFQDLALCENLNVDREPLPRPRAPPAAPRRRGDGDAIVGACCASSRRACRPCGSPSPRCRVASARPSPSPARCSATPRSSSSTSPRRRSASPRPPRS